MAPEPEKTREQSRSIRYHSHSQGDYFSRESGHLLVEMPLEIVVNGESPVLVMCTPGRIHELVIGFLFTEGFITRPSQVETCRISDHDGAIRAEAVIPTRDAPADSPPGRRVSFSACGICGKQGLDALNASGPGRVKSAQRFSMDVLKSLPSRMTPSQPLYNLTGGAHAAILFDHRGTTVLSAEDMGRHNALDKVIGAALLEETDFQDKALLSSGRASLEMILKTARAGVPVFVAKSRPTTMAVEAAKHLNITLADMARGSHRIYTHVRRIQGFR